jgi:hypothetical protein
MTKETERKVRQDLIAEERERLEKYGSIEFRSAGATRNSKYEKDETNGSVSRLHRRVRVSWWTPQPSRSLPCKA